MVTFYALNFLEFFDCVVDDWDNVEDEDKKLNFRPPFRSKSSKREIAIINFETEPRPFHLPCLSLILMEVFKRFGFFSCNIVKFREGV